MIEQLSFAYKEQLQMNKLMNLFNRLPIPPKQNFRMFTSQYEKLFNHSYTPLSRSPSKERMSTSQSQVDPYLSSRSYFKMFNNRKSLIQINTKSKKSTKKPSIPLYETVQLLSMRKSIQLNSLEQQQQEMQHIDQLVGQQTQQRSFIDEIEDKETKSKQRLSEQSSQTIKRKSVTKPIEPVKESQQSNFTFRHRASILEPRKIRSYSEKAVQPDALKKFIDERIFEISQMKKKFQRKERSGSAGELTIPPIRPSQHSNGTKGTPKQININVEQYRNK